MAILDRKSLTHTIDRVNEVLFFKKKISESQKKTVANWLASRQGLPGSYANMFALLPKDRNSHVYTFTGEKISSNAAKRHILGEETCRVLLSLGVKNSKVQNAIMSATKGMVDRLTESRASGIYCCGMCSCSLWRHLTAGGLDKQEQRLAAGMRELKKHRDNKGRWGRFPFYYTLLALEEIDLTPAVKELHYAAPLCERLLDKNKGTGKYDTRRKLLLEKTLAKC
jgi:hypothetical protein